MQGETKWINRRQPGDIRPGYLYIMYIHDQNFESFFLDKLKELCFQLSYIRSPLFSHNGKGERSKIPMIAHAEICRNTDFSYRVSLATLSFDILIPDRWQ